MESVSLNHLADEQLATARSATSGRSALTVHGGHDHMLRQTLIALAAGKELAEHNSPGQATLQVLRGRVRVHEAGVLPPGPERQRGGEAQVVGHLEVGAGRPHEVEQPRHLTRVPRMHREYEGTIAPGREPEALAGVLEVAHVSFLW